MFVWPCGKMDEMNVTFAFAFDVKANVGDTISVCVSASNLYKFFAMDQLKGYGPARAAHGYARVDSYTFTAPEQLVFLTFEVASYRVNTSCYVNETPFFYCEIYVNGIFYANAQDAICYELTDRVQKVQKYSFERTFVEVYRMKQCRSDLYLRKTNIFPKIKLEKAPSRILQERGVKYPSLEKTVIFSKIETGSVEVNPNKPLFRDRTLHGISDTLLGFSYEELEDRVSDTVSQFVYTPCATGFRNYVVYDGCMEYSGLISFDIVVDQACELFVLFDEIVWEEEDNPYLNGEKNISFSRLDCCNIVKYMLEKGVYHLQSYEIYSFRFLKFIYTGSCCISNVRVVSVESSDVHFTGTISDEESNTMLLAALRTYRQNSLDILMDCPSRERAGWTNDSFFSSKADLLFSGTAHVERNFLENVLLAKDLPQIPKGMIPMCYPCDHIDGNYIPQCGMWNGIEMCERAQRFPEEGLRKRIRNKIERLLDYYRSFENDDGLLENLQGWRFIEWSKCNDPEYNEGVNYPTNMLYYGLLKAFGKTFGDTLLLIKATQLKETICRQSYNGTWFEDNRVRENGELVLKGHVSETCQYYAFYFGIAERDTYPDLYVRMFESEREDILAKYTIVPSNIIFGLLLRMELLMRFQKTKQLVSECKNVFLKMSRRTYTLWEHNGIQASCNHGLTSILGVWLVYAYTGYIRTQNGVCLFSKQYIGTNCSFSFTYGKIPIEIIVENGVRTIKTELTVEEI